MDGIDNSKQSQLLVIGATNHIDRIDKAIARSGRLGRHIEVNIPQSPEQRFPVLKTALVNVMKLLFGPIWQKLIDGNESSVTDILRHISRDEYTDGWK